MSLAASIGNGYEGYYTVESDGDHLIWRGPAKRHGDDELVEKLEPSPAAWRDFWSTLDSLDAWSWNGQHYETPDVMDGTYWQIEAANDGRVLSATGNNGYPGSTGPEPSPDFEAFCSAVSQRAGGRSFS